MTDSTCFPINDKYRINSDSLQWIPQEMVVRTNKETGEKYDFWKNLGYYTSLSEALQGLADRHVRISGCESFNEAVRALTRLTDDIEKALKLRTGEE